MPLAPAPTLLCDQTGGLFLRTLAIANQKGGVGKTTTCVNLSAALARRGYRILMIDLDSQMSTTVGVGVLPAQVQASVYDLILGTKPFADARISLDEDRWHLLPSSADLAGADLELAAMEHREFRLRRLLAELKDAYDFVLMDCPPALTLVTLNALVASDGVIIPLQCEYYALAGLASLLDTLERVRLNFNSALQIEGVLRTMYDPRNALTLAVSRQLTEHFGDKLYRTIIPRNVRLAEAPSHGLSAYAYDRFSKGAIAHEVLAQEFIRRQPTSA